MGCEAQARAQPGMGMRCWWASDQDWSRKKTKARTRSWPGNKLKKRQQLEQLPVSWAMGRAHRSPVPAGQQILSTQPISETSYSLHQWSIEKIVSLLPSAEHLSGRCLCGGLRIPAHSRSTLWTTALKQGCAWVFFQEVKKGVLQIRHKGQTKYHERGKSKLPERSDSCLASVKAAMKPNKHLKINFSHPLLPDPCIRSDPWPSLHMGWVLSTRIAFQWAPEIIRRSEVLANSQKNTQNCLGTLCTPQVPIIQRYFPTNALQTAAAQTFMRSTTEKHTGECGFLSLVQG